VAKTLKEKWKGFFTTKQDREADNELIAEEIAKRPQASAAHSEQIAKHLQIGWMLIEKRAEPLHTGLMSRQWGADRSSPLIAHPY